MTPEPYHMSLTCLEGFKVIKKDQERRTKTLRHLEYINEMRAQMIVKSRYIFPWLHQEDSSESK